MRKEKSIKLVFLICCGLLVFLPGQAQQGRRFDSIASAADKISFTQGARAYRLIEELYAIARHSPDSLRLMPQCLYTEASWAFAQGVQKEDINTQIKNYLSKINEAYYPFEDALLRYSLALCNTTKGNYGDAFSSSLQALHLFERLGDTLFIAKTLNMLGIICGHVKLLPMAYDYYSQAIALVDASQPEYYQIYGNLCRLYFLENNTGKSIDSLKRVVGHFENEKDTASLVKAYINLTACYSSIGNLDATYEYCTAAQTLIENIDNSRSTISLYQNFAAYYFRLRNFPEACEYFKRAMYVAESKNMWPALSAVYGNLSFVYETLGQPDSAFFYLKKQQRLASERNNNAAAIAAYHDYISTFLEASHDKLIIAEQKIALQNRQLLFFVILAVAVAIVIIVVILLLVVVQQKRRLKEKENKELVDQLEHEKKIQELHEVRHREDIDSKTREITTYSLQLSDKNNILKQILDLSKQLAPNGKNALEINGKIRSVVRNNLNTDHEWDAFKQHFDKVHPRFFDKLKLVCSDLTENNLRLCAYFRIGIPIKQIAQILNISHESVFMNRHRLRKKLNLAENESLEDFLRAL